jgi:hypothetical protein
MRFNFFKHVFMPNRELSDFAHVMQKPHAGSMLTAFSDNILNLLYKVLNFTHKHVKKMWAKPFIQDIFTFVDLLS